MKFQRPNTPNGWLDRIGRGMLPNIPYGRKMSDQIEYTIKAAFSAGQRAHIPDTWKPAESAPLHTRVLVKDARGVVCIALTWDQFEFLSEAGNFIEAVQWRPLPI